jgi:hypothetical protein
LQLRDRSPKEAEALVARFYAGVDKVVSAYGHPLVDPIVAGGPPFADRLVDYCERNRSNSLQQLNGGSHQVDFSALSCTYERNVRPVRPRLCRAVVVYRWSERSLLRVDCQPDRRKQEEDSEYFKRSALDAFERTLR